MVGKELKSGAEEKALLVDLVGEDGEAQQGSMYSSNV
jgi:hypothetical protein